MTAAHRGGLAEAAARAATRNGQLNLRYAAAIEDWAMRWHDGDPAWVHERFGFEPDDYGVDLIPYKTAVGFVTRHHYSRSVPALRKYRFGLFCLTGDRPELCGVALLSIPPRKEVLTNVFPHLEAYHESAELGRLVLLDQVPHGAETRNCWSPGFEPELFAGVSAGIGTQVFSLEHDQVNPGGVAHCPGG